MGGLLAHTLPTDCGRHSLRKPRSSAVPGCAPTGWPRWPGAARAAGWWGRVPGRRVGVVWPMDARATVARWYEAHAVGNGTA